MMQFGNGKSWFNRLFPATFQPYWLTGCVRASCWTGPNAAQRMMNILSPHMDERVFKGRVKWMRKRGCDTAHLYLSNQGDGEYAGYCPYGTSWGWEVDKNFVKLFRRRMKYCRRRGLAVVVWLFADDSGRFNREAAADFARYVRDCRGHGLFDYASAVCAGLELGEYYKGPQVAALVGAIRKHAKGYRVLTHENSYRTDFASLADGVMYQMDPGAPADRVRAETAAVIKRVGKPVWMFELARTENRDLAEAALAAGAKGVGNW